MIVGREKEALKVLKKPLKLPPEANWRTHHSHDVVFLYTLT